MLSVSRGFTGSPLETRDTCVPSRLALAWAMGKPCWGKHGKSTTRRVGGKDEEPASEPTCALRGELAEQKAAPLTCEVRYYFVQDGSMFITPWKDAMLLPLKITFLGTFRLSLGAHELWKLNSGSPTLCSRSVFMTAWAFSCDIPSKRSWEYQFLCQSG